MKKNGISLALAMAAIVLFSFVAVSTSVSAAPAVYSVYGPTVVSTNGTNLNLVVMGSDGNIYTQNATNGSTWGTSTPLGGANDGVTAPSAVAVDGNITVFARGSDGALYSTTSNATNWTGNAWTRYGGGGVLKAGTGPSAVNNTTVFVTGNDSKLYEGTLNTDGNFSWLSLGGVLTSSPGATLTSTGITVFVGGTSSNLWSITNTAGV